LARKLSWSPEISDGSLFLGKWLALQASWYQQMKIVLSGSKEIGFELT